METLNSHGAKRHGYHKDLVVNGVVPELATCLLDACQSAWVFGGMGCWNDMSFESTDQAEYDRLSEELFNALNRSNLGTPNRFVNTPQFGTITDAATPGREVQLSARLSF